MLRCALMKPRRGRNVEGVALIALVLLRDDMAKPEHDRVMRQFRRMKALPLRASNLPGGSGAFATWVNLTLNLAQKAGAVPWDLADLPGVDKQTVFVGIDLGQYDLHAAAEFGRRGELLQERALPARRAVVGGEDKCRPLVDADLFRGLDDPVELTVEFGEQRPHVRALGALKVAEGVEVGAVDGEEIRDLRHGDRRAAGVHGPPVEDLDGRVHPLLEEPAGPDVEVLGVPVGGAVVLHHVPLHRRGRPCEPGLAVWPATAPVIAF